MSVIMNGGRHGRMVMVMVVLKSTGLNVFASKNHLATEMIIGMSTAVVMRDSRLSGLVWG
jgi:uncharacterized membrane-anchored protein YitT (DUF2179 family)